MPRRVGRLSPNSALWRVAQWRCARPLCDQHGAVHFPLLHSVTLGAGERGPRISPIVISRIMYNPGPDSVIQDEYIELHNRTNATVPAAPA